MCGVWGGRCEWKWGCGRWGWWWGGGGGVWYLVGVVVNEIGGGGLDMGWGEVDG